MYYPNFHVSYLQHDQTLASKKTYPSIIQLQITMART